MILRGMAVAALAIGSLAANCFGNDNVAPTKAELEEMYNGAYRAFDGGKFPEALKQLDAIDARQPDLAASKNLRGVILMRQGNYDQAEAALQEASRIDPKFWNARFNMAEIPFLKKDWEEARKRFQQLLSTGQSDLAKEASQLIQYKVLLTYLMEDKGNMVDSMLAKLELSPDTPAVDYVKAAVALKQKNEKEAKDWISAAEKNFSPQLNKLFAESLYEVGWLEKPAGAARPSLPLMTAAERSEKTKAAARSKFEQAQQALRQRDLATALKLVDEADKADPNQPATLNLRGEILMQQQQFDQAEAAFKKAAKLDPKLREAQYNLAQIPFKKKNYAQARERFEALYKRTPGGDKNQAAELIKFKIYMTLLLEGKESKAHAMMEDFQFTGDTPALYYAQAAWEYKHNNAQKAADWTGSANKIYSAALNSVFADAFYDVGWMQRPEGSAAPAVAFDTTNAGASQTEGAPAVEPSPIPDKFAASQQTEAKSDTLALAPPADGTNSGMQIATTDVTANQPTSSSSQPVGQANAQTEQAPAQSPAVAAQSTTAEQPPAMAQSTGAETATAASAASTENNQQAVSQTAPPEKSPVVQVITKVPYSSIATLGGRRLWIVGGLLFAAVVLLAWVIVPIVRRHASNVPRHLRIEPPTAPATAAAIPFEPRVAPVKNATVPGNGLAGGPRQISIQLEPWKAALRPSVMPSGKKSGGAFDRLKDRKTKPALVAAQREPDRELSSPDEGGFEGVGPVVEQAPDVAHPSIAQRAETVVAPVADDFADTSEIIPVESAQDFQPPEEIAVAGQESNGFSEDVPESIMTADERTEPVAEELEWPDVEASPEFAVQSITQEQPDNFSSDWSPSPVQEPPPPPVEELLPPPVAEPLPAISAAPVFSQITTPVTMPETTQTPTAPTTKPPTPPLAKPQPPQSQPAPAGMQTSVQLTFSFEIAAMQLTPSFKMGVLKVRPISKLVTMRLPSPQRAQSALNLQVAFEVVKIQPVAGALGTLRVIPSQQQRPTMAGMPSFAVAGLQVVPNSETAPVQLTPSQQGRASVFVTVPFQIGTLEFSPSLEIASVILNSNSKQVVVQLPGAGPGSAEGAPMFEIANLELGENGDISMMQLNLLGGPKRA